MGPVQFAGQQTACSLASGRDCANGREGAALLAQDSPSLSYPRAELCSTANRAFFNDVPSVVRMGRYSFARRTHALFEKVGQGRSNVGKNLGSGLILLNVGPHPSAF